MCNKYIHLIELNSISLVMKYKTNANEVNDSALERIVNYILRSAKQYCTDKIGKYFIVSENKWNK